MKSHCKLLLLNVLVAAFLFVLSAGCNPTRTTTTGASDTSSPSRTPTLKQSVSATDTSGPSKTPMLKKVY
ncbi:MAG: hypothetical protein JWP81_3952 [Ferruginibacter sp.]|nr:hypothetical protein [Ferruginibacter sp.]